MENDKYEQYLSFKQAEYESICKNCGVCCGATDGDPCQHLKKTDEGKYFCAVYENRLGPQQTVSGKIFTCTTIRHLLKTGALRAECAYVSVASEILNEMKKNKENK